MGRSSKSVITPGASNFAGMTAYGASKDAVIALTRTLAVELAADNSTANCVCREP